MPKGQRKDDLNALKIVVHLYQNYIEKKRYFIPTRLLIMAKTKTQSKTKIRQTDKAKTTSARTTSGRGKAELQNFKLGETYTDYSVEHSSSILEAFDNKNPGAVAWTTFICTEFTSLCPKTGQPDFAKIFINYIADKKMVESKSLKLYLFSFRNHGDFHEDCVQTICRDLFKLMQPKYIEVIGEFTPRGGIAIFPFASMSNNEKQYQELKNNRLLNYAPGKYSMELSKLY